MGVIKHSGADNWAHRTLLGGSGRLLRTFAGELDVLGLAGLNVGEGLLTHDGLWKYYPPGGHGGRCRILHPFQYYKS